MSKGKRIGSVIYIRTSNDSLSLPVDFDVNIHELASRWNTTENVIRSSISKGSKVWCKVNAEEGE